MSADSVNSQTSPKDNRIALRLTENQKILIEAAAALSGRTVSDFSLTAILAQAERTLADQTHLRIPPSQWEEFLALLEAPVEPNPGLADLLSRPSVFDL